MPTLYAALMQTPVGNSDISSLRFAICGAAPMPAVAAVVLDGDGRFHRMADVDEVGVIAISGPNVFKGYLDPRHNAGVWIDIDGESWLNTGDLGRRDTNGYFWLTGRRRLP